MLLRSPQSTDRPGCSAEWRTGMLYWKQYLARPRRVYARPFFLQASLAALIFNCRFRGRWYAGRYRARADIWSFYAYIL